MKRSVGLGGSIVSKLDNGWRFLSDIDTDEFLSNPSNMSVCDWITILEIEPAILGIFDMPIGTDITLIYENGKKYFIFTDTGEILL